MNTTTLNMTTLDGGNVIIKRGGGGGTTINNQDKVVDITENGTTEVVADGGYTGLGKVTINTEVGGGGDSTIEYEYYALTDRWLNDLGSMVAYCSSLVKAPTSQAGMVIASTTLAKMLNNNETVDPVAVAVDMSLMISSGGQQMTIKDVILGGGTTEEGLAKYRITKEEFYNLD